MKQLLSAAFAPISTAWRLAESRIWLSIALLAGASLVSWLLSAPMVTLAFVAVLSLLLMRVEPLADAAKAAAR